MTDSATMQSAQPPRLARIRPWMVVTICCILYLALVFFHNGSSVFEFIFPRQTEAQGYDGQFTYFLARDPASAPEEIRKKNDFPAYRIQRVLHAALSRALSLGQDALLPWAMLAIDIAALAAGTAALEQLLTAYKVSRWYALTYGLFGGVFFAVLVTTAEPLAFGLVLLAVLAYERSRLNLHAVLLSLAVFAKEPAIISVGAYVLYFLLSRRWRDTLRLVAVAVAPFILWQIALYVWLGEFGVGSGGGGKSSFEVIPFNGMVQIARESLAVFALFGPYLILGTVIPTLWALYHTGRDILQRRWHHFTFLLFANAAIIPFTPFSTYREPLGIVRFVPGLVLSFVLYTAMNARQRGMRRPLLYSTLWIVWGLVLVG